MGLVFQFPEYQLFEETIARDISFGPKNFGVSEEEALQRTKDVLKVVGLDESYMEKAHLIYQEGKNEESQLPVFWRWIQVSLY